MKKQPKKQIPTKVLKGSKQLKVESEELENTKGLPDMDLKKFLGCGG